MSVLLKIYVIIFESTFFKYKLLKIPRSKIISGHKSNTHKTVFDLQNLDSTIDVKATVSGDVPK